MPAFYLHSYRVLNDSMLIVRDDAFCGKNASIDSNKSSRTISIESFKTRNVTVQINEGMA